MQGGVYGVDVENFTHINNILAQASRLCRCFSFTGASVPLAPVSRYVRQINGSFLPIKISRTTIFPIFLLSHQSRFDRVVMDVIHCLKKLICSWDFKRLIVLSPKLPPLIITVPFSGFTHQLRHPCFPAFFVIAKNCLFKLITSETLHVSDDILKPILFSSYN